LKKQNIYAIQAHVVQWGKLGVLLCKVRLIGGLKERGKALMNLRHSLQQTK